jgi:Tripartite tricarboxylate transporter TctB family
MRGPEAGRGSGPRVRIKPRHRHGGFGFQGALVLLAILALAGIALVATPSLIKPFPVHAAWYESSASFPRAALILTVMAAAVEFARRRQGHLAGQTSRGSDELDSSLARPSLAFGGLMLFIGYALAVPVVGFLVSTLGFLVACGVMLQLARTQVFMIALVLALGLWIVFVKVLKVAFGHGWFM